MADVLTVSGKRAEDKISFSGTTEEDVLAVSCSLKDKDEKEIDFSSVEVSKKEFSGSFSNVEGGETIACANYDGGEIVVAVITEEKKETKGDRTENDETVGKEITPDAAETGGDESIGSSDTGFLTTPADFATLSIFIAVFVAIVGAVLVLGKGKKRTR